MFRKPGKLIVLIVVLLWQAPTPLAAQEFFKPSDHYNPGRVNGVVFAEAALGTAVTIGLNYLWYKKFPRSPFHFFNDNNEWLNMDKMGHAQEADVLYSKSVALVDGMIQHANQFSEAGIPFIFDPGQGLPMFDGKDLKRFVEQATWVAVNDYEWQMIQQKTGWTESDVTQLTEALIVTRGPEGSVIHTKGGPIEIPCAKPKAVVDPTGCGDAYRAGLIHGLLQGLDWKTTGRIASLMGAIKIEALGTQNHKFTPAEFKERLAAAFPA